MKKEEIIVTTIEGKWDSREWEDFQPAHELSPDISGKLWSKINKNTAPAAHYSSLRWMAVAASVLLLVGLSWLFILRRETTSRNSAGGVAVTKNISNPTPQKKKLTLSDGSTVELSPNSTLSYPEKFNSSKRYVILNGEANFNIAKDVAKPFSVYSNSVLITVLGTRFTVNSYEANNATKVILHEGRVMIKIADSSSGDITSQNIKNEYYLSPGDIFIFKKLTTGSRTVNAEPIATEKKIFPESRIFPDSLSARILHLEKDKDDGYIFNNYPLDVVFDQLQIIYNTKIIYNKADLGNRSFIGKIDKKDSLYPILKSIALLNKFGLHQQGDSIIISK